MRKPTSWSPTAFAVVFALSLALPAPVAATCPCGAQGQACTNTGPMCAGCGQAADKCGKMNERVRKDAADPQGAAEKPEGAEQPAPSAEGEPGAGGMRAYIDPQTGKFTAPPPNAQPASDPQARGTGDTEELEVVPAPGGGEMVDLKGRFLTHGVAKIAEDGKLESDCTAPQGGQLPGEAPKP